MAQFEKGHVKTGGRKPGSTNRKHLLKKPTKEWFEQKNIHPLDMVQKCLTRHESAIELIEDPVERARAYNEVTKRVIEVLPYVLPKIKEQESSNMDTIDLESLKNASTDGLKGLLQSSTQKFQEQVDKDAAPFEDEYDDEEAQTEMDKLQLDSQE